MSRISARQLREFRRERGLTQAQLATALGISRSFLSNVELGKYNVPPDMAEKLEALSADAPPKSAPVLGRLLSNYGITPRQFAREIKRSEATVQSVLRSGASDESLRKAIETWLRARGLNPRGIWNNQEEIPMEAVDLTDVAKARFRIFSDPFDPELNPELFFGARKSEWPEILDIESKLRAAFLKQKNIAVRGQVGSGKSTLVRRLLGEFERNGDPVFVIEPMSVAKERLTASVIVGKIIRSCYSDTAKRQLGNDLDERSENAVAALASIADRGLRAVALFEEAHLLPDDTIKHFKSMSEWYRGADKLLSIVMIGQPELDQKIKKWTNRQWFSRCVTIHMPGLGDRIPAYLKFRCDAAGVDPDVIFEKGGLDAIRVRMATQTYDTPLLVNNFAKHCVNKAAALGCKVNERVVMEARPVLIPHKAEVKQIRKRK